MKEQAANTSTKKPEDTSFNFLSFGEILWDIIEGQSYLGGAPFNVAAHMARCGAQSYMLTRIGQDALGQKAFAQASQLGVNTSLMQQDAQHPTGTVDVYLEEGQPDYIIHEGVAWDYIEADQAQLEATDFRGFYFGTLAQRNEPSRKTLQWILDHLPFDTICYDVNLRKGIHSRELISDSLSYCHVLKLNEDEVTIIAELLFQKSLSIEAFARLVREQYKVDTMIITASEKGCYVFTHDQLRHVEGKKVKVVDAVGAGDAFSAAFLWKYMHDKDAIKAAATANALGAFVAASRGAIPDYSAAVQRILQS